MIQGSFRAVKMKFYGGLRNFQGSCKKKCWVCFKEVLGLCGEYFIGVSGVFLRVFEAISIGVSKQFHGSFQRVSGKFEDCFKSVMEISKVFQRSSEIWVLYENFKGVSRVFNG